MKRLGLWVAACACWMGSGCAALRFVESEPVPEAPAAKTHVAFSSDGWTTASDDNVQRASPHSRPQIRLADADASASELTYSDSADSDPTDGLVHDDSPDQDLADRDGPESDAPDVASSEIEPWDTTSAKAVSTDHEGRLARAEFQGVAADEDARPAAFLKIEQSAIDEADDKDRQLEFATARQQEEINAPRPSVDENFELGPGENDLNRAARRVTDVPLDIRPAMGTMPVSVADTSQSPERAHPLRPAIVVGPTPWTFCYRPLYFEDIPLERYGRTWGVFQLPVSTAKGFFSTVMMPYKMVVRPPRSCVCSNGFSRCGDQPLPGYGRLVFRIDASLVEVGLIAGILIALP
jgi:hypothetical protein